MTAAPYILTLSSAGIAHIPVAAGSNGIMTKCNVLLPKTATQSRVYSDWRGPRSTVRYGAPCAGCFGKEGEK